MKSESFLIPHRHQHNVQSKHRKVVKTLPYPVVQPYIYAATSILFVHQKKKTISRLLYAYTSIQNYMPIQRKEIKWITHWQINELSNPLWKVNFVHHCTFYAINPVWGKRWGMNEPSSYRRSTSFASVPAQQVSTSLMLTTTFPLIIYFVPLSSTTLSLLLYLNYIHRKEALHSSQLIIQKHIGNIIIRFLLAEFVIRLDPVTQTQEWPQLKII